ncbi:ATP-binding cassette domain-containing protein [Pontibaca sp. S1109L]|uniref:ATP-binding cassette domain-containing protein n=1 Tax=Pontibaca salina TaxID=2795731 RepID=A0A934HN01_9RHOB|nr:ATP-binding cassette domain-containing protein [Pontibaca salina]MBI6629941.1 ATP-binding cassette domain-containing protein [Pontibaca salina]
MIGADIRYTSPEGTTILDGVSITLPKASILAVGGPSGAGKSTLARILSGHTAPSAGTVEVDRQSVLRKGRPRAVQYAPQSPELSTDPRWTVGRILANGGLPQPEILDALGVQTSWVPRLPAELSGGQLQRVSLARLLRPETKYLICDEITAQLDALSQKELWDRLTEICRLREIGLLVISHDITLRHRLAQKTLTLARGRLDNSA